MKPVCVVIPVHQLEPSPFELISFKQCFNILSKYEIKIIAPAGLSLNKYREVVPEFKVIYIDPSWQSTLLGYNRLKTSKFFYELFSEFEFLLTYELDAFIFKDDLSYWCSQGYDYIGAPWFEGLDKPTPGAKIIGVGNSGFSLRRVKKVVEALNRIYYKNPIDYNNGKLNLVKAYIKFPYYWLRNKFGENYSVQNSELYEDRFFSEVAPLYLNSFKIAPIEKAIAFSFEVLPDKLFILNNNELPMGCHAWWRYDLEFWRPFIEKEGYML